MGSCSVITRRRGLPLIFGGAAGLLAVACSAAAPSVSPPPAPSVPPTAAAAAPTTAAAARSMRTIVDQKGRSVQIPTKVSTVATNYPICLQFSLMLGAGDKLVATPGQSAVATTIAPRLATLPNPFGGNGVNVEDLVALKPDVIVSLSGIRPEALQSLAEAGLPVVVLNSFQSPDDLKGGVNLLAQVLGEYEVERAKQFAAVYDANVARVTAGTASLPQAQRWPAFYCTGTSLTTEGKGTIVENWMAMTGAVNVAARDGVPDDKPIALEQVLAWDPTFIISRDYKLTTGSSGRPAMGSTVGGEVQAGSH